MRLRLHYRLMTRTAIQCAWCGKDIDLSVEEAWATLTAETVREHADCFHRASLAARAAPEQLRGVPRQTVTG